MKRKLQIGVIGSMQEEKFSQKLTEIAQAIGREIAEQQSILLFGFEGDQMSLSQIAADEAIKHGGETIAFLFGKTVRRKSPWIGISVATGMERGGGREFPFVLSCDVIIAISGGSGTLLEMAIAYQFDIPIVAVGGSGGWSDKLKDRFLDARQRRKVVSALNAHSAVQLAIQLARV